MYWADKTAKQIIESGKYKPYWVDDMFTPSGYAHIGHLRGITVHDLIFKALIKVGKDATFTYILNDFDVIDGLPEEFKDSEKYMGVPLRVAPSPKEGFENFADFFASDYKKVFEKLGIKPEFLSSWDMYHEGKFNDAIKTALDNAEIIQNIYYEVSGSQKKEKGWLPLQVICENCGKLGTTRVHEWNGETVAYICEPELVIWAKGCGHEARISPFDGNGKLPWKVDWPAHWMVLGVTIEGGGKDHSVAGSSRDVASEICKKVFKIEEPFNLPYEFLTIGGKKMSSSKGIGLKARDLFDLLPAEVGRFLYCRTDYRQEVNFDPFGTMAIPDLFDEYDRCWISFIDNSEEDLARTFEMAQIDKVLAKNKTFIPRFRDVANYIQTGSTDLAIKFSEVKGSDLNDEELEVLKEREKYARIWLEKYAPEDFYVGMSLELPEKVKDLTDDQKKYLTESINLIENADSAEKLQVNLYDLSKEQGLSAKDAFASLYTAMNGKTHGPQAAVFLLQYPKEKVIERLKEATK